MIMYPAITAAFEIKIAARATNAHQQEFRDSQMAIVVEGSGIGSAPAGRR